MAKDRMGGKRAKSVSNNANNPSQAYLAQLSSQIDTMWDMTPQERFDLASIFTNTVADDTNFFENSVGFWDLKKSAPKRTADHISYNRRTGKVSSQYWYTDEGVYRKSDHWGSDVSSCSWYISGRKYSNDGVSKGKSEVAFIKWTDLKAKGIITKHYQTGKYSLSGFDFKK